MINAIFDLPYRACVGVRQPLWDYTLDPPGAEKAQQRAWRLHEGLQWCQVCPVMQECRTYGVEHHETGLWGGILLDESGQIVRFPRWRHKRRLSKSMSEPIPSPEVRHDDTGHTAAGGAA